MNESTRGALYALGAYGTWGVAPIYFVWAKFAGPDEVLVHRVVWSVVLLALLVTLQGRWREMRSLVADSRKLGWLTLSGTLIAVNWLVYIWALQNERIVEASLGYYINPLINVLLGYVFLAERPSPLQWLALSIAGAGVANEIANAGNVPLVGLFLALSFGTYGLVRKRVGVGSVMGLTVETALLAPIALAYFGWLSATSTPAFGAGSVERDLGLVAAGIVTAIPLVWFASAALRLSLTVLGLFQYIGPTLSLLLAVFIYGEPFRSAQAVTFGCIWTALVIFTTSALYDRAKLKPFSDRV